MKALYATRNDKTVLVSTSDYDIFNITDEEEAFADLELPGTGMIRYFEEEV
jgi:hypothetical protein